MHTWPIAIETVSYAAAGTVLWRHAGRLNLTVVVKAKLTLDEGLARLAPSDELLTVERFAHQSHSLSSDVDIAPYKPRAEVTFVGHAWSRAPVQHLPVRLGVQGDGTFFDKRLHVVGDRAGPNVAAAPFQKMPLRWERAWLEPTTNPVGVDRNARHLPNIFHQSDANTPAGYGPIARAWPARTRFVGRGDPRRLEGSRPEMPNDLSWGYFLAAPPDQQLERLRGNEVIVLENLIDGRPRVRTQLPNIVARANLFGPMVPRSGQPIDLKLDTLTIDGDRQCTHVVWRGTMPVVDEASLHQTKVVTSIELGSADLLAAKPIVKPATPQPPPVQTPAAVPFHPLAQTALNLGSPATVRVPPQTATPQRFSPEPKTMPVGKSLIGAPRIDVPKLHEDGQPLYDLDDDAPESVAGSTMAIDPEAAMKMLTEARSALPFSAHSPRENMSRSPSRTAPPKVPLPPPPPPLPPMAPGSTQTRQGTMEIAYSAPALGPKPVVAPAIPAPDDDDDGGGTMVLRVPDDVRRR